MTAPFNPAIDAHPSFGLYDSSFNDLDNLFEGFFDLSMPTIWQDPLFDGDAFSSADLDLAMSGVDTSLADMHDATDGYEAGAAESSMLSGGTGSMGGKMPGSVATGAQSGGGGYPEITMH
jgi:hypothetical protein